MERCLLRMFRGVVQADSAGAAAGYSASAVGCVQEPTGISAAASVAACSGTPAAAGC